MNTCLKASLFESYLEDGQYYSYSPFSYKYIPPAIMTRPGVTSSGIWRAEVAVFEADFR